MCSLLVKKKKKNFFFVSEKKIYSRISRIFKLAFLLPKVDFFIGNDFHALLNNGLLSVDATLQALILLLKFSLITRQLSQSITTVILLTCIFNSNQKIPRNAFFCRNWLK